jgi:hypothetical protein
MVVCLGCALRHGPMLRRSLVMSAVVGTALAAINQGDVLLNGPWVSTLAWKIPLTYAVPFIVATVSALLNNRVPSSIAVAAPIPSVEPGVTVRRMVSVSRRTPASRRYHSDRH